MKNIVQRFLNWKLPEDFMPDGHISFDGWAEAMLRAIGVADLIEERDRLKRHAEAMAHFANVVTDQNYYTVDSFDDLRRACNFYRADFPKEET